MYLSRVASPLEAVSWAMMVPGHVHYARRRGDAPGSGQCVSRGGPVRVGLRWLVAVGAALGCFGGC